MSNGYVVWRGPSLVDGAPLVCIVTGTDKPTSNRKTGDMLQMWILREDIPPHEAVKSGEDTSVCGDCPFSSGRGCYVAVHWAPLGVWRAYHAGAYSPRKGAVLLDKGSIAKGRKIRFGAYGDPGLVPYEVLSEIAQASDGWTGYTHMWDKIPPWYRYLLMASVESAETYGKAKALGYRCFYVVPVDTPGQPEPHMMQCAAERDRNPKSCADCMACAGTRYEIVANAVDVWIDAHGSTKKHINSDRLQSTDIGAYV